MKFQLRAMFVLAGLLAMSVLCTAQPANPPDWSVGDVFAGVANGSYQVWHSVNPTASNPTYSKLMTISDGLGGATNGCGFDLAYRFFGTNSGQQQNQVDRYSIDDQHGIAQSITPGAAATFTQSVTFDGGANLFIGFSTATNGSGTIERWSKDTIPGDATFGQYIQTGTFSVPVDNTHGPGWIDLDSDGVTLFYTSQGSTIRTLDTSTGLPGPTFATLSNGTTLFALRILPHAPNTPAQVLVAAQGNVLLVQQGGTVSNKYQFGNDNNLQALSLDSSVSTRAWVGDASSNDFILFDFTTKQQIASFNTGSGTTLGGICVDGSYSAAETAVAQIQTPVLQQQVSPSTKQNPAANTVTFPSPFTGATFSETFSDLTQSAKVTVRDSLVDPSLALSDPTVFSFNPGSPTNTLLPGNMACDTTLTAATGHPNTCEVFEVEVNPNSAYTTANTLIEPPTTVKGQPFTALANSRMLRNLDEDITDDVDLIGTRSNSVYTVNKQVIISQDKFCSFTPVDGSTFTKSGGTSTITFKLSVTTNGLCGSNSQTPTNLLPLLMIVQKQTNGTVAASIPVLIAGKSGGPPVMTLSGNTYQLQVKTTDIPSGFTYVASVVDLSTNIASFSTTFTMLP